MIRHFSKINRPIRNDVFSDGNRERTVQALSLLKPLSTMGKEKSKVQAAVLVPLCTVMGQSSLLLTVRSMRLRNNRGQVAFPGGLHDATDRSLEYTALRETYEEVGISKKEVDIWGPGPTVGRMDMSVTPFVAQLGEINPRKLIVNANEVEKAFAVPLETMCDPDNFGSTYFRSGKSMYQLPVFSTDSFRIWGLTALIAHTVLQCLLPEDYKNRVQLEALSSRNE